MHCNYEYVRGNVTTNTIEGFFGLFKRGVNGVYLHFSKEHLHRYLAEFDFRYNHRKIGDQKRTLSAIAGFEGKRLALGLIKLNAWERKSERKRKTTNEKPISLYPLSKEEVLKKLLQAAPPRKGKPSKTP